MKTLSGAEAASAARQAAVKQAPMRICMHDLEAARTDVRVMREANALVEAGFDVTIVDAESDRARPVEEDIGSVHLKHIINPNWFLSTRFKPWFLVKAAGIFLHGVARLLRVPADMYHAHDLTALPACYIAARLRRKPLIYDAHEMPLAEQNMTRWRRLHAFASWCLARIVPYCADVITVSPPIATEIQKRYHARQVSLVRNVPVYQEIARNARLREHLELGPGERIALYQGVIQADRELDRLIRAARFLEPGITLVLIGNGPKEMLAELRALIASEGVEERVKMVPALPYAELLTWTASADLGLIIYAPERSLNVKMCLPNKFFEYLMAGVPVLSSQLEVLAQMIETYDVGYVARELEPEALAHAIDRALADPAALARMSQNARRLVRDEFNWERERRHLIDLYHAVLQDSH